MAGNHEDRHVVASFRWHIHMTLIQLTPFSHYVHKRLHYVCKWYFMWNKTSKLVKNGSRCGVSKRKCQFLCVLVCLHHAFPDTTNEIECSLSDYLHIMVFNCFLMFFMSCCKRKCIYFREKSWLVGESREQQWCICQSTDQYFVED